MSERWIVVVAPRGDVVRLLAEFDDYSFEALTVSFLRGTLQGYGASYVSVSGRYVSVAWKA